MSRSASCNGNYATHVAGPGSSSLPLCVCGVHGGLYSSSDGEMVWMSISRDFATEMVTSSRSVTLLRGSTEPLRQLTFSGGLACMGAGATRSAPAFLPLPTQEEV